MQGPYVPVHCMAEVEAVSLLGAVAEACRLRGGEGGEPWTLSAHVARDPGLPRLRVDDDALPEPLLAVSGAFVPVTGHTRPLEAMLPEAGPPALLVRGKRFHIVDELEQDWEVRVGTVEKVRGENMLLLLLLWLF